MMIALMSWPRTQRHGLRNLNPTRMGWRWLGATQPFVKIEKPARRGHPRCRLNSKDLGTSRWQLEIDHMPI
jgi:hypothetical protein